jgi:hypothetical protein
LALVVVPVVVQEDLLIIVQLMRQLQIGIEDILYFVLGHLMPDIVDEIYDYTTTLTMENPVQEH